MHSASHPPTYWLDHSETVVSAQAMKTALAQMAQQLQARLAASSDADLALTTQGIVLLCVMRGGLYLAGQMMERLGLPARLDYLQANRYQGTSGHEIVWRTSPELSLAGQIVVVLDDILDAGITLAEVVRYCQQAGATQVLTAVLCEKDNGLTKPIQADVVGVHVPDRYVFGCGMDVYGWWRNLPEIRALTDAAESS